LSSQAAIGEFVKFVSENSLYRDRVKPEELPVAGVRSKEPTMPSYEINYLHDDGSLAAKFAAQCRGDKEAKILAHAMKLAGVLRIEVWNGKALIYTRPQRTS
jgi:hypothetical protein